MSLGIIIAYFVGWIIGYITNRRELREVSKKATEIEKFKKYTEEEK